MHLVHLLAFFVTSITHDKAYGNNIRRRDRRDLKERVELGGNWDLHMNCINIKYTYIYANIKIHFIAYYCYFYWFSGRFE